MGKSACFTFNSITAEATLTKVDRDKVYGYIEEMATDEKGKPCTLGAMLDDGKTIIMSGSTALKTVDESGREADKKSLKTVNADGTDAKLMPSIFDGPVVLTAADIDAVFNMETKDVYQVSAVSDEAKKALTTLLDGDKVYAFQFNYRADYEAADALLVGNGKDIFILTGRMTDFQFMANEINVAEEVVEEAAEENEEEMDFGML